MQTQSLGPRLLELATATGCLSPRQIRLVGGMLAEIGRLDRRKTALAAVVGVLNPDGDLSAWKCALALESTLKSFSGQPLKRILAGYRQPTEIEIHLLVIAADGPQCARKLWSEIRELI